MKTDDMYTAGRLKEVPNTDIRCFKTSIFTDVMKHRTGRTGPQNRYILSIETRPFSLHSQLTPVMQILAA